MQTVSTVVSRSLGECWRVFTDPVQMTAWVPGLRAALVIETGEDGLPREMQFEFATDLVYSLLYTYDAEDCVVRWEPRPGETGAVRGYAKFTEIEGGTEVTYALAHEPGRKAAERAIDNPRVLVDAFARLMHGR